MLTTPTLFYAVFWCYVSRLLLFLLSSRALATNCLTTNIRIGLMSVEQSLVPPNQLKGIVPKPTFGPKQVGALVLAFSKFSLQMDAPRPYLVLLARRIASSSSWRVTHGLICWLRSLCRWRFLASKIKGIVSGIIYIYMERVVYTQHYSTFPSGWNNLVIQTKSISLPYLAINLGISYYLGIRRSQP